MFSKQWFQCGLAAGASLLAVGAVAASAGNHYVTVGSDTVGVEEIVPVDDDFYVTTRGVGAPDFIADISVSPNFSWRLVYPSSGKLELGIGASDLYEVEDSTGSEDSAGGRIEVLKLDIAPSETNICWKSSGVTLSLTPDSALGGGTATWSSEPTGISGSGTSIAVNPGSLAPGEYVVTAASTIVPSYADTCVVRIIKVDVTQAETYVCWKSSAATLNLTADSYLGDGTAEWTSVPTGISGSGTSITFNPSGLTPTGYVVTARSSVLTNCTDTCTVNVISVDLDDSDLWFFRNDDYELPLTITPSSASDLVNVSVSGFDSVHWTAAYNSPLKKIDFSNLILESELVGWLDEQELSISAGVGSAADSWSWTKKLKLKKRVDGLWDDAKQDAIDTINDYVSPADDIKSLVENSLVNISAVDSEGLVHTIPPGAISSAANFAYAGISTWWANFVGAYIWSDVPVSELHEKVTKESWTWDWSVDAEIEFSGGSISLDPSFDDAVQWIESISDTGFASQTFVFENAMIGTSVTANGETANADIEAVMNAFLRYANETVIDIETGETAEGRIEYGIGISLHIWF